MPRCQNKSCSKQDLKPEELFEEHGTGDLFCSDCASGKTVLVPERDRGLVLGREFDYGFSYTRKHGLRANARLGGATISLQVDQDELNRTFGLSED